MGNIPGPTYRKHAQGEDTNKDRLLLQREPRLQQYREGDENDHDVGADIQDRIGDQVVRGGRALSWSDPSARSNRDRVGDTHEPGTDVRLLGGTAQYWLKGRHQTPR